MGFNKRLTPTIKGKDTKVRLEFNEALHKYTYNGKELESVTTWIHRKFCRPFNSMGAAMGKKKSSNMKGIKCLNPKQLVKYWKLNANRAANRGTAVHVFAEMYDMDPFNTYPEDPKEYAFIKFTNKANSKYKLVATEQRVYSEAYGLAGTVDRIYYNPTNDTYIIADLKTSKELDKHYNKMLGSLKRYNQTKINTYRAQLTVYKALYKALFGKIVSELWIVHLKPDSTYEVIKVEPFKEIEQELGDNIDYDKLLEKL